MSAPAAFGQRLLEWYDRERRDLPWRQTRDPWAIWVSEVMLQQTRVEVVRVVFPRFMQHYPTPAALAGASEDELLHAWRGLGYYRRARSLQQGAREVAERHGGRIPAEQDLLCQLPGIGEYTSGAIASIAFDRPALAVDGNVERVVARHQGILENPRKGAAARQVREVVGSWQDRARPGDFNQALMELGATVCTPRTPRCPQCPVAADCQAARLGLQESLPALPKPPRATAVETRFALVRKARGRVIGTRVPSDQVNAGQVELPGPGVLEDVPSGEALAAALERKFGVTFVIGEVVARVSHAITNHRINVVVHRAECARAPGPNLLAARPDDYGIPWTTVARKVFDKAALFLAAHD